MTALLIDTETTGMKEPEPIEIALDPFEIGKTLSPLPWVKRFRPSKPIELGALATHHIMDEELLDCPPSSTFKLPDGTDYLIGYNVDYDWQAIGKPAVKRIDVCAMCRSLWPAADTHSQGAMLYLLKRDQIRDVPRDYKRWLLGQPDVDPYLALALRA